VIQLSPEEISIPVGLDNLYRIVEVPGGDEMGFRGAWDRADRFTVQQVILGTWIELELNFTIDGDQVTYFQHDTVDGGNVARVVGEIGDD
jgi:hypothetical protein